MTYLGLFPTSVIKPLNKLYTTISRYRYPVFKENNRTVVMGVHCLMPSED